MEQEPSSGERIVRGLAVALAANQVVGTAVARRYRVDARPFGIRLDLGPSWTPVVWGTGISAPLVMAAALVGAACFGAAVDNWRTGSAELPTADHPAP